MEEKIIRTVIDRVDQGIATLQIEDSEHEFTLPVKLLPEKASEGTWLDITIKPNLNLTEQKRAENRKLLDKIIKKNRPEEG